MADIKWSSFPTETQILPGDSIVGLRASVPGENAQFTSQIQQILSCRVLSISNLNANYNNGTAGVGATLTDASGTFAELTIDGITLLVNDRVAVAGQTSGFQNGIYYVVVQGDGVSIPWQLQRALDFDQPGEVAEGRYFTIDAGTVYNGDVVVVVEPQALEIGIDAIKLSSSTQYVNGKFLPLAGGTMSGDIVMSTTTNIKGDTTNSHTFNIQAYDPFNSVYRTFITFTNGTPTCTIAAPVGGSSIAQLFINNAIIGLGTANDGYFNNVQLEPSGTIRTSQSGSYTFTAFNTGNSVYDTVITMTAGNPPTFNLGSSLVTSNIDYTAIGQNSPNAGNFTSLLLYASAGNNAGLKTGTGSGNLYYLLGYNTNANAYNIFGTMTAGNPPTFALTSTSGNNLTIDAAAIGSSVAGPGTFSTLTGTGNIVWSHQSVSTSSNATTTYTGVTDNSSARTITLLTADLVDGTVKIIKDEAGTAGSSNNITIVGQGSQTIDGASSLKIVANYGCARLIARNSKWWTM